MRISAKKMKTGSGGFSLVELLIATALISILLAIGVPAVSGQISHIRLSRSVRDVAIELNAARLKAIAKNKKHMVDFTVNGGATPPDTYRLKVCNAGSCPNAADWANEPSRPLSELAAGISISSPGASFTVEFFPNGAATARELCILNTNKAGDDMKITVSGTTGMITVQTGC